MGFCSNVFSIISSFTSSSIISNVIEKFNFFFLKEKQFHTIHSTKRSCDHQPIVQCPKYLTYLILALSLRDVTHYYREYLYQDPEEVHFGYLFKTCSKTWYIRSGIYDGQELPN